jgi:HlyD family secretion protein
VVFHPGMSCRAEVLTAAQDDAKVLAVPVQAVRYEDNPDSAGKGGSKTLASVFVYDNGRAKKRTVTTGTADDSYIAITDGLKAGERIVVGPSKTLLFLLDGEKLGIDTSKPASK